MKDPSAPHRSHARGGALQRGRSNPLRRPPMRVWVWTAATVALVVVAALLWRGSDAAATESTTAAPADVPAGAPAGAVSEAWSATGEFLPRTVVQSGRVLVGSEHGVRALDPLTGEEAWHYTRSNARMCGLVVTDGVAVAVFATEERCDEAVALDAGTGVRAWTRSVSFRGDATLDSTDRIVLASSPTGIVTLDPDGSNIRWRYAVPGGCHLVRAAAGSTGVAVLERCDGAVGVQLRLFDGFDGSEHWSRDLPAAEEDDVRLVGADGLVAVRTDDEVQVLSPADGSLLNRLPAPDGTDRVEQAAAGGVVLVLADGTLTALDSTSAAVRWRTAARGLPTATADAPAALLVPEDGAFVRRDPATGDELGRSTVSGLPAGGTPSAIGPVVVHRLPDRVVAYR
jgi:outer membrane protein assembly factor BamB